MLMKTLFSVRLGVAVLLATGSNWILAQELPRLLSQTRNQTIRASKSEQPGAENKKRPPTINSKLLQPRPGETDSQQAERHEQELAAAEVKVAAMVKELPLLSAPGWEQKQATFKDQLDKLKNNPEFKRQLIPPYRFEPGQRPVPKTAAQITAERKEADFKLMRQQADKVLETHPELRDFVEQQFQWHQQLFALIGKYPDNRRVRDMVASRIAHPGAGK